MRVGADYESIAKLWLYNKKFGNVNMVIAAVCWSVWKLRNNTWWCLAQQGNAMVESTDNVKMLESLGAPEENCWL
jgi:hypothetical protein